MLTFVFLGFGLIIVIAAIVISVMANKRKDGKVERPPSTVTDTPKIARANGNDD